MNVRMEDFEQGIGRIVNIVGAMNNSNNGP
jgi:hypothetical protein